MAEVTLEGIRNLLNPRKRRLVVFCSNADLPDVAAVCKELRREDYEVVEKAHAWLEPGAVYVADADLLQTPKFTWDAFPIGGGSNG